MKTLGIILLLFISVFCSALVKEHICTIDFTYESNSQIKTKIGAMSVIEKCVIYGYSDEKTYDEILSLFVYNKELTSIQFIKNNFKELPKSLNAIPNISKISILGNNDIILPTTFQFLKDIRSLRELEVEIPLINDLPKDLLKMYQLEKLILHEHLCWGEEKASESVIVDISFYNNRKSIKDQHAVVYVSKTTWEKMHHDPNYVSKRTKLCLGFTRKYENVNPPTASFEIKKEIMNIPASTGGYIKSEKSAPVLKIP